MLLADTSVWIPFFRNPASPEADLITKALSQNEMVCINAVIELEILQGIRSDRDYGLVRDYLVDFQYFPNFSKQYFDLGVEIYRGCRRKGVTIRKSLDCLIAANALIDGLEVLHKDRDFAAIGRVFRELRVRSA